MIDVKVSGNSVDYTNCSISDRLNDASTASFNFYDPDETNNYPQGTPVQIYDDDGLQFSGFVDKCKTVRKGQGVHTVSCVDNHYLAKKRTYNKKWVSVKAGDVVRDMVNTVLKYEGVRGFNLIKEYNSATMWNTGTTVGATPSDSGITLAKSGTDKSVTYSSTAEFDTGVKANIDSSTNQIVISKEGSLFTKVWTVTADFDTGSKTNLVSTSDQLQLTKTGTDIAPWYGTKANFDAGTKNYTDTNIKPSIFPGWWYDDFADSSIDSIYTKVNSASAWVEGAGFVQVQPNSTNGDFECLLINNRTYTDVDMEIVARVAVGSTVFNVDSTRTGVCLKMGTDGHGFRFLIANHNGTQGVHFLHDSVAWGSGAAYTVAANTWYWMKFRVTGAIGARNLYGKIWQDGSAEPGSWTISWTVTNTTSQGVYPALSASSNNWGYTSSYTTVSVHNTSSLSGTWVSPAYSLAGPSIVGSTWFNWAATVPANTSCTVETSLDAANWQTLPSSGSAIPQLPAGTNLSGKSLYVRVTLYSSDMTNVPIFLALQYGVNSAYNTSGSWQSSSQTLAVGYAKTSSLAWNWNIPASCSITMKTSIDGGTSWQTITTSGNAIGNVTLRTNLVGKNLLVRAEFVGTTAATPTLYDVTATIDTAYKLTASWVSPQITLDTVVSFMSGNITWNAASVPANTTLALSYSTNGTDYTALSSSPTNLPYTLLESMAGKSLWLKVEMTSNGVNTPTVYDFSTSLVSAYNTIATWDYNLDLSDVGASTSTAITYTLNAPTNSTATISISLDGDSWTELTSSGGSIPGINNMDYLVDVHLYVHVALTSNGLTQPSISYLKLELYNGTIKDGLTLNEVAFGRTNCNTGIQLLANRCSFWWCIDAARVLWFCDRNMLWADPDTFSVLDMTQPFNSEIGNTQYRNKQYIKGGNETTELQTQSIKADGTARAWPLSYNIKSITDITVGGVSVGSSNIGSKGDSGKKWYYTEGDPILMHGEATPIANGTIIVVSYYGTFPMVVQSQDDSEIATRKGIEGVGTGIVENVVDDSSMTSSTSGLQYCNNLLATYANMGTTFSFPSWNNYAAGTLIKADMADYGYDMTQMLIVQVDKKQSGDEFLKSVTVTQNNNVEHWSDIFKSFDKSMVIRDNVKENEILVQSYSVGESWSWTENVAQTETVAPKVSETTYPSESIFPS